MTTVLLAGGGTGGHLMPALAVADAVRDVRPDWRFVFAGAERGIEAQVLPARGLPHHLLPLEPIYRQQWWKNVRWPFLLPRLLRRIDGMLDAERPTLVIGTGGYASGPVLWRAARRGFRTALLDLDVRPGIATRWAAPRADAIWVAAPEAVGHFPPEVWHRTVVTGAPITRPDPLRRQAALARFGLDPARRVLVVTGGSQGSLAINRLLAEWLKAGGLGDAQLIWATGPSSYQTFASLQAPPLVTITPFLEPMADAWAVADICVARAGMMTIAALCAWGIPSVLIPLPTSAADHQRHNARAMEQAAAAIMLEQEGLTVTELDRHLGALLNNAAIRAEMAARARARAKPDAAREIADRVIGLLPPVIFSE